MLAEADSAVGWSVDLEAAAAGELRARSAEQLRKIGALPISAAMQQPGAAGDQLGLGCGCGDCECVLARRDEAVGWPEGSPRPHAPGLAASDAQRSAALAGARAERPRAAAGANAEPEPEQPGQPEPELEQPEPERQVPELDEQEPEQPVQPEPELVQPEPEQQVPEFKMNAPTSEANGYTTGSYNQSLSSIRYSVF